MIVKNIFWNSEETRIRAGWRILTQMLLMTIFTMGFGYIDKLFINFLPASPFNSNMSFFQPLEALLAVYLSMLISGKYLDKRPFSDFGFTINNKWILDLGSGIVIGIVLMSLIFLIEYNAGWITVVDKYHSYNEDFSFTYGMLFGGYMFLMVGFYEEMIVRGYLLKNFSEGFNFQKNPKRGILIAIIISSLLFGFGHASNPNATIISSISITFAGVLLAAGYLITGRLAIPIGLHISWNFFQGYVFGFPVSGNTSASSIIMIKQGGPDIWTGGAFGPEAGLIGIVMYFVGIGLIYLWVKYQDKSVAIVKSIGEYQFIRNDVTENDSSISEPGISSNE